MAERNIDNTVIPWGKTSASVEEVADQIKKNQMVKSEREKQKRIDEYKSTFRKNAAQFVPEPRPSGMPVREYEAKIGAARSRFEQRSDEQMFSFVQGSEAKYQKDITDAKEESAKQIEERIKYLKENIDAHPEYQVELNHHRNYALSNFAAENPATQIARLGSRDPKQVEYGVNAQAKVDSDLIKYGNATAADMETINVMRAATVIIPKYSPEELAKNPQLAEQYKKAHQGTQALSNDDLMAANSDAVGGKASGDLLTAPTFVAGKDNPQFSREGLTGEVADFEEIYKTSLIDPDAAAYAHAEADMEAAGIDPYDYTGTVIDNNGEMAFREKSVAQNLGRNWKALSTDKNMSFAERNKEAVKRSMQDAGVTPSSVSPQEYLALLSDSYKRVQLLRDAGAQAAITTSTLRNAELQASAYEGIMSQMNELVTSTSISADALTNVLEKSQGMADAMAINVLAHGSGKMEMLDQIDKQDFRQGWANTAPDKRMGFFANAVLDVMMDYTRNLKDDEQVHGIAVVRRLKEANSQGKLSGEPLFNHLMNTMYEQFKVGGAMKIDQEAAMLEADLMNNATAPVKIGGSDYIVAAGRGGTVEEHKNNIDATRKMVAMIAQNEAGAEKVLGQMGVLDGKLINPNAGSSQDAFKIIENIRTNPMKNGNFAASMVSESKADVENMMSVLPSMSKSHMESRARAWTEAGKTTPYTVPQYMLEMFGGPDNKYGMRIAQYVNSNKNLHKVATAFDPVSMEAVILTAMDGIQADVTQNASAEMFSVTTPQAAKPLVGGARQDRGLPDDLPQLANRPLAEYPDVINSYANSIVEETSGTTDQFSVLADLDKYQNMVKTIDAAVNKATRMRDNVHSESGVTNKEADEVIESLRKTQLAVHASEKRLNDVFSEAKASSVIDYRMGQDKSFLTPFDRGKSFDYAPHKDKDFVRRMFMDDQPYITNPDGSRSTHRMAAEVTDNGEWIAFPTIIRQKGKLVELKQEEGNIEAQDYAIQSGEYISFGTDAEAAKAFAKDGYKRGTMMDQTELRRPL